MVRGLSLVAECRTNETADEIRRWRLPDRSPHILVCWTLIGPQDGLDRAALPSRHIVDVANGD
jgi:hypothetical protein